MGDRDPKKADDELTLWIGGVMLLIILILGVLWVQQGKEIARLQSRCVQLEAEVQALRQAGSLSGMIGPDGAIAPTGAMDASEARWSEMGVDPNDVLDEYEGNRPVDP